jgi:5'-3' exonuclease
MGDERATDLLLIDGNNLAHRVFWTHRQLSYNNKSVSLLYGFFRSLIYLQKEFPQRFVVIAWDNKSERRMRESAEGVAKGIIPSEYKANRKREPDEEDVFKDMREQIPILREGLNLTKVLQVKVDGYEADDVLYTYALQNNEAGGDTIIVTSDRDYYQLLSPKIRVFDAMNQEMWTAERFTAEWGYEPAKWVELGAICGDKCFVGSTRVKLLNGKIKTMKELAEEYKDKSFDVYSCNKNGEIVVGKAHSPKITGTNSDVYEVHLDNGEIEKCTPDHLWMLSDGTYKKASELTVGESLMPFYYQEDKYGYEEVYVPKYGNWKRTHKIVGYKKILEKKECRLRARADNSYPVLHHKDFNKKNNTPENLQWMTSLEHFCYHSSLNKERWKSKEYREKMKAVCSKGGKIGGKITAMLHPDKWKKMFNEEKIIKSRENMTAYNKSDKHREVARKILTAYHYDDRYAERRRAHEIKRVEAVKKFMNSEQGKRMVSELGSSTCKIINKDPIVKLKQLFGRVKNIAKNAFKKYGAINQESYNKCIVSGSPKWQRAIQLFGEQEVVKVNHKVIKVVKLSEKEDVYDFKVLRWHNFALASGVFVHNSDNIHGVSGWGQITANKYLIQHGNISNIRNFLLSQEKKSKKEVDFLGSQDRIALALSLKQMDKVPFVPRLRTKGPFEKSKVEKFFLTYGFASLIKDIGRLI